MFVLLLCCLTQPQNELYSKLDALFDSQVNALKNDIAKLEKTIDKSNPVLAQARTQAIQEKKAQLNNLLKNYAMVIPDFDFSKGVKAGDVGNAGYHTSSTNRIAGYGPDGKPIRVNQERVPCPLKVIGVEGKEVTLTRPPFNSGEHIVVSGFYEIPPEEKVLYINIYISEYLGKENGVKRFKIIGNSGDFAAWRKYRLAKK